MKLADLTWKEVFNYLKTNQKLIISVGTCEEHSLHLPLNTDTLTAEKVADEVSKGVNMPARPKLPSCLIFPLKASGKTK